MHTGEIFHLRGSIRLETIKDNYNCVMFPMEGHGIIIEEQKAKVDVDLRELLHKYLEKNGRGGIVFGAYGACPPVFSEASGNIIRMPFLRTKCSEAVFTVEVAETVSGFELKLRGIKCIAEAEAYQTFEGDIFE